MPLDQNYTPLNETKAMIISMETIDELPQRKKVIFGSGAEKCKAFFKGEDFQFRDDIITTPSAKDMVPLIAEKYAQKKFEDVAYFEPLLSKRFLSLHPKILEKHKLFLCLFEGVDGQSLVIFCKGKRVFFPF